MSDILEIKSGELYIHGNHIPRHEEKPWLFSASAVHKALEGVIRKKARIKKKDKDSYFHSSRPSNWFVNKFREEGYVAKIANRTRNRIRKFGLAVGFGLHCLPGKTMTYTLEDVEDFEDKELVYSGIRGNGKKSGTYLCQHAVVDYTAAIDADFRHELIDLFTQVVNGNVEEVVEKVVQKKAKGTPERAEDKSVTNRAYAQMHNHGVNPRPVLGEVTRGVFGKSKKEVMEEKGIEEPFNDNLSLDDLLMLTNGRGELTRQLSIRAPGTVDTKEAKRIGYASGVFARVVANNSDKLRSISEKLAAKEEAAREAALLSSKTETDKANKASKKKKGNASASI